METIRLGSVDGLPEVAARVLDAIAEKGRGTGVVAFYGPMGAGKTTLIREICALLGVADTVTSPTFAIVNQYMAENGEPVYHFDFYRVEKVEEAFDMGYEEYFYGGGLCLVEWPGKIEGLLPEDALVVRISAEETGVRVFDIG